MPGPITVVCLYRVRSGGEAEFIELLKRHWPTLHRLGLATDEPARHFQGPEKKGGGPLFIEIFQWASEEHSRKAHENQEVMAVWDPMGRLTETREGRPSMEFHHGQPLNLLG
jgi:hypothetical protein